MELTQALRRAAQIKPHETALIFRDRAWTWRAYQERVAKLASALRGLGLGEGDRVAILAHSSDRYIEAFLGPLWAGGAIAPLNVRLSLDELAYCLKDTGATILLVDRHHEDRVEALRGKCPAVRHVIWMDDGEAPSDLHSYEALLLQAKPMADAGRGGDDLAGLWYTGGTTGRAKGVMLSHNNLYANALNSIPNLSISDETRHIHAGPLFHLAAAARVYTVTIAAATHVVIPKFDVTDVLETVQQHRVTTMVIVPTMAQRMLKEGLFDKYDLSSLRHLSYGASPMPERLMLDLMAALPNVTITQSYGMTELSPVATQLTHRYHTASGPDAGRITSAGKAVMTAEVRVVDPEDNEVPSGAVGEVVVRGPMVMLGYWNRPEETAKALRHGWMHTGDAGYMDEDGFVFIVDRIKDMIITGGENVFCVEVEDVLFKHPAIAEACVFGIPHEDWGEQVHAVVVPRAGMSLSAEDVIAHAKGLIASYKCPKSVEVRAEPLPVSAANKVQKAALRAPYWDGRTRQVN